MKYYNLTDISDQKKSLLFGIKTFLFYIVYKILKIII